jgi:hypothetical protein
MQTGEAVVKLDAAGIFHAVRRCVSMMALEKAIHLERFTS